MHKVVHLTSVHKPFDNRIFEKECRTLASAGYEVVLIVPADHDSEVDGIKIRSAPKASGRLARMTKTTAAMYKLAEAEDASFYHFHDPELIPMALLLLAHGKHVIYDVHEDVAADILTKAWLPLFSRRIIAWAMRLLHNVAGRAFSAIVVTTPMIGAQFPPSKTFVVHNYPVAEEFLMEAQVDFDNRPLNVVYIGGISRIRGISEMIEAMRSPLLPVEARLILAGRFEDNQLADATMGRRGWERVDFVGWKQRSGLPEILGSVRAGLVLFHPNPNHDEALPQKMFEYMSAGIPVIASNFPLWRKIINKYECGILVDPLDPNDIARGIAYILNNPAEAQRMGNAGKNAIRSALNWSHERQVLLGVYSNLLAEPRSGRKEVS